MKTAAEDVAEKLDRRLAEFLSFGEALEPDHEFIANFVGPDEVLLPTYKELIELGCRGDPPAGGGWIYMHVCRPLTRDAVLQLTEELQQAALRNSSLFDLLEVHLLSPSVGKKR